jgi:predicted dehydrogenase
MGISVGLVGLGQFGRSFADLFKAHPAVDRIALCDGEPDRVRVYAEKEWWRDKFHPRDAYASLDEICKSDLDALVIITQPWLHAPQCIRALESGKHVYSAVPVMCVPDSDEILDWCDKLVRTCRRTGMHYMLGETTYYHSEAMYCRRRAAEGAFGDFVYSEGEYMHPYDGGCDLREVQRLRQASRAGRDWPARVKEYQQRGLLTGPMHYPTHSVSGPMCVMKAHALKVCAWGFRPRARDPYFDDSAFSNETALFQMTNGSTMRICEFREIGGKGGEVFRVYGTMGSFEHNTWRPKTGAAVRLSAEEMRDPLPKDVAEAFRKAAGRDDFYGGHGGSHAYLTHEFVDAIASRRRPAIHVWEAVRYMAAGATAHKSALKDGEVLPVPDWGDGTEGSVSVQSWSTTPPPTPP